MNQISFEIRKLPTKFRWLRDWRVAIFITGATIPILFVGIIWTWRQLDVIAGNREVAQFIEDHRELVQRQLRDPRVHSFSLSADPNESATLLIRLDVDDKATHDIIEADLDRIWEFHFPPNWETTIRSNEKLGNNYGYAAAGIGLLVEAGILFTIAAIASLAAPACFWLGVFTWRRRHRAHQAGVIFSPQQG
jgi:hypothetical protein